jgi:dynein heavy chain
LQTLLTFDRDSIPPETLAQIRVFCKNPAFVPEQVKRASKAAMGLCVWVRAVDLYHMVRSEVRPKQEALGLADIEHQRTLAALQEQRDSLAAIQQQIADLQVGSVISVRRVLN